MPEDRMVGKTIANYHIDRKLGQGGMASVYQATDNRLQRKVAIKIMHPHLAEQKSFQQRFLQEARAAASLDHPNIVRVLTFDHVQGELFIVMELIEGGNLRGYMKRLHEQARFIDFPEAVDLTYQIAQALDYAHNQGMIHRDIKPDNVVLKPAKKHKGEYIPMLTDFGLAKLTASSDDAITDQPLGTYAYMSPEQTDGLNVDARTDIYSLGIMLYELAVGKLPYQPHSIAEAARMHGREPLPTPSEQNPYLNSELEAIILKSLEKDPEERYQTAGEMANDLAVIQGNNPETVAISSDGDAKLDSNEFATALDDQSTPVMQEALSESVPIVTVPPRIPEHGSFDRLLVFSEDEPPIAILLDPNDDEITIGSANDREIVLRGTHVSRSHAKIERRENGDYYISDMGSKNGTYLGDTPLESGSPTLWKPGKVVRLADYWLEIEFAPEDEMELVEDTGDLGDYPSDEELITSPPISGLVESAADAPTDQQFIPQDTRPEPQQLDTKPEPEHPRKPAEPNREAVVEEDIDAALDQIIFFSESQLTIIRGLRRDSLMIGREGVNDVVLQGEGISRNHARIERNANGDYTITDLGSTNGTYLGTNRLEPELPVAWSIGEIIQVGTYFVQIARPADDKPVSFHEQFDPRVDGIDTAVMDAPIRERMPMYASPPVTEDQAGHDRIVFYSKMHSTIAFAITKDRMTIGRGSDQDIQLVGTNTSRTHAVLERKDGIYRITDVGATNPMYVGELEIKPNTQTIWKKDEIVRLADYWVEIETKTSKARPKPVAVPIVEEGDPEDTQTMYEALSEKMPSFISPPRGPGQDDIDRLFIYREGYPLIVSLFEDKKITIGRGEDQDVQLDSKMISRRHARIEKIGDAKYRVTDMGSKNGVWLGNELLISGIATVWDPWKVVRMGDYWIRIDPAGSSMPEQDVSKTMMAPEDLLPSVAESYETTDGSSTGGKTNERARLENKVIGPYRVATFIGRTSRTAVYEAFDTNTRETVAIRVMHPHLASQEIFMNRFLEEARTVRNLEHPNIVNVLNYDQLDGELFMVMEYISGGNLRGLMREMRANIRGVNYAQIIDVMSQMSDGLHYAHQQGMLHRDIRPENIVLQPLTDSERFRPILTDFVLATHAETGEVFDTDEPDALYPYMSPEQAQGERIDPRSDIYELGTVLYEFCVGQTPFRPRSISDAVRMHGRETVPRPTQIRPGFPIPLERVILRSLEKNPNDRYQTAAEFSRALQIAGGQIAPLIGDQVAEEELDITKAIKMSEPLPDEMPWFTPQPVTQDQVGYERLIVYSDDYPLKVVPIKKDVILLGRDEESDVVLEDRTVSMRHARLERSFDEDFRVMDIGSENGTWIGNARLITDLAERVGIGQVVRIGKYWIRIEEKRNRPDIVGPRTDIELPDSYLDTHAAVAEDDLFIPGVTDVSDDAFGYQRRRVGAAAPVIDLPAPEHDKVNVKIEETTLHVAPGSSVTMVVEIHNQSELVDHFIVSVDGLPLSWMTVPPAPVYLMPNNRDTVSITFHPPLESSSTEGAHAFEVRVHAQAQDIRSVTTQGALIVAPFQNFVMELEPERIRNRGRAEILIINTGNTHTTYTVHAKDKEQVIRFDLGGKQFTIPPGQREEVSMRVAPRKRHFFGLARTLNYEIKVTTQDESIEPQTTQGELIVQPIFPGWLIAGLVLLLTLCIIISFFAFSQLTRISENNQTATAVAIATSDSVTATAIALSDSDGDGLSNFEESEGGTDPNIADTDGDGLSDGDEVRVWLTDPLKQDTDEDTLLDGNEVNRIGSDPLKMDTDDDGIPDNEDTSPTLASTPLPTPFPTIPGSDGEICPGSPPTRLEVGMLAFVESGGVANRLRDMPGVNQGLVIDQMLPGESFIIINGPECDPDQFVRWWKVNYNGQLGWTAEGEGEEYYLRPPEDSEAAAAETNAEAVVTPAASN